MHSKDSASPRRRCRKAAAPLTTAATEVQTDAGSTEESRWSLYPTAGRGLRSG